MSEYGIHWFRRDLRLEDNPALSSNREKNQGRVVGLFCFDKLFLARPDFSNNRFQFFLETLLVLREELRKKGSDLLFVDEGPLTAFPLLFRALKTKPALFSWNRDYEPFAVERDKKVEALLGKWEIPAHHERDHLLIEPHEIYKGDDPGDGYVVYTPFFKKWIDLVKTPGVQDRLEKRSSKGFALTWKELLPVRGDPLNSYYESNQKSVSIALPPAGHRAALARLRKFEKRLSDYADNRNIPSVDGTSQMSFYLKNGSITTAQIIRELRLTSGKFLGELAWREFYYHILFRFPHVEKTAFLKKYEAIEWENDEKKFEAWKKGEAGFPIVDAAMRQLNTTGWMHNRLRMIVASFLTKDLLIDWRWGERYFMEKLIDGDLAPNNGGWQWAASTGCDPQPYFRIFNPSLQGKRFDPKGVFIRRYLPELAKVSDREIHEPRPNAIVDHAEQRILALALYKQSG